VFIFPIPLTVVKEGGKAGIMSSELPIVVKVEMFVQIEPPERDTTESFLSAEADRKHLLQEMPLYQFKKNHYLKFNFKPYAEIL